MADTVVGKYLQGDVKVGTNTLIIAYRIGIANINAKSKLHNNNLHPANVHPVTS